MDAKRQRVWVQLKPELCIWCKKATYSGRAYKTETIKSVHWTYYYLVKNSMYYCYSHEISQQTIYNMDLILFFHLVRDDAFRIRIRIKFHSLGAVYEYDLSNKEQQDLGTANAPLTDDRSVRSWVSASGFSKSVIYWVVKLFMALCVETALLYFNGFTICSR